MMPATSSTYVQHALWNYPSHALREQKTKLLTARGPESTVCTASLRKSAKPAYWPRRVPALGQRCTARGRAVCTRRIMRTAEVVLTSSPDSIMTHEKAQLGPDMRHRILAIWGSARRQRIVIKQSNAAQKSNNQIPLWIPLSHPTPKLNQNNQNPGRIPGNVEHWVAAAL